MIRHYALGVCLACLSAGWSGDGISAATSTRIPTARRTSPRSKPSSAPRGRRPSPAVVISAPIGPAEESARLPGRKRRRQKVEGRSSLGHSRTHVHVLLRHRQILPETLEMNSEPEAHRLMEEAGELVGILTGTVRSSRSPCGKRLDARPRPYQAVGPARNALRDTGDHSPVT